MELTPDILRTFVAAARTLNFTKAGIEVHRTQSAVSIQIRKLEESLGCPLFRRVTRGVELTDSGLSLLRYANRLLQLHNEAVASVTAPQMNGVVRLGAAEDYAALHLPLILKRFAESYPLVQVELYCDLSNNLLDMLAAGQIDICLRNTATLDPGGTLLGMEPLVWVSPVDASPEELSPLPIAVFHPGCIYRGWAIQALENQGRDFRIAYSSPSISGVLAAVRAGLAVSPVGASTPLDGLRVLSKGVLPALPSAMVSMHLAAKPEIPAIQHLARYIEEAFCAVPRWARQSA